MQFFLCSCCCCRTFELRRELPCFTRMTLYSLTVTLALFYALFAVERGCTVLVCVGGGWRCSIHSIAIDLHVCKRGESLALFSVASLVVVVDVSHSSFLWQIRLHSRFDLRHRHTHTHSCCCGRGGKVGRCGERTLICTRAEFSRCRWCCAYVCTRQRFSLVWSCDRKRQINEAGNQLGESNSKRASTVRENTVRVLWESAQSRRPMWSVRDGDKSAQCWKVRVCWWCSSWERERNPTHVVVALLCSQRVCLLCSGS